MQNTKIYPLVDTYEDGWLQVDSLHKIYWQQSGNPNGLPVVILHGGPGAGLKPDHRQYFDPKFYRIIAFDQRGAGKSIPLGELSHNTTQDLIADMEKLREHLKIDHWLVSGSSWGSTLALYYAQNFPDKCLALLVRSVFLGTDFEVKWGIYDVRAVFPEAWESSVNFLPEDKRSNILQGYHELLMNPDPEIHIPAALQYLNYFGKISRLIPLPPEDVLQPEDEEFKFELNFSRIQSHYHINHMFLKNYNILENIKKISHLPGYIIHGRFDMCCPVISAYELSKVWEKAELIIVPNAGHSNSEGSFPESIVKASDSLKSLLS